MLAGTKIQSSTSDPGQEVRIYRENMVQDRAAIEMADLVVEVEVVAGVADADKEPKDTDNEMDEALPNAADRQAPVHQWSVSSNRYMLKAQTNLHSSP